MHTGTLKTSFPMDFAAAYDVLAARSAAARSGDAGLRCDECVDDPGLPIEPRVASPALANLGNPALLRLFLARQEERVGVYRRFERGFASFLQVTEAEGYETLVECVTSDFSALSVAVNDLEAELRSRGGDAAPMAAAIRTVQRHEKEKLQLTAQLQIVRHGLAVDALHAGGGDTAAAAAAERTAALRGDEATELRARLAEVTSSLNETLDEVRCELADAHDSEDQDGEERAG